MDEDGLFDKNRKTRSLWKQFGVFRMANLETHCDNKSAWLRV